ncbi:MAG: serine/threonine-protein kinase PknK, partial [Azospirillaceae bacterium]
MRAGPRSVAYRGHAHADGRRVIVKFQREIYPSERALAAETRAFEIARTVAGDCLPAHLALLPHGHGLALVTEDFGGESLDLGLQERGAEGVAETLAIGIALARALGRLHAAGIVHRDIGAGNVAWNARTRTLRLLDLKECSLLEREEAESDADDLTPAMLVYAAPERSGRLNRAIDARSDLYAAGVLLFEVLAGRPPFALGDARELRHAHLARPPPRLDTVVPETPPILAAIVERLLAKNPDDRYGSAMGLAHDLERCLAAWQAGDGSAFALGQADAHSRFVLPDRLYGRAEETRQLFDALAAAREGRPRLLLVAGFSGVGKSVLVNEVRRPIAESRGWYCAGKFDQYLRDVPYLAWSSVLASLVKQLLAEPEERLAELRTALDRALAGYGALIGELVPEIEQLLGPQPGLPDATPAEAQARFARAVSSFVETLARAEHPLVIFIDDLQWADLASLQLLETLAGSGRAAHLLILGAYRDNEVGPGHPLAATIARLTDAGQTPTQVVLQPLGEAEVRRLVADTVQRHDAEAADLGDLVHRKTGGNPFFVRQFLADLARKDHLAFDHATAAWRWDRGAIEAEHYTDNVVDFMSGRIGSLSPDARAVLEFAACLGVGFDLRTLVGLSGETYSAVAQRLDRAMAEGLIVPLEADYRLAVTQSALAERRGAAPTINPRYRFLHDRVQAGVHDGIEPAARARLHLRIARSLLAPAGHDGGDENAIAIMDHLQECLDLIEARPERLRFARVCLAASRRALASTAVGPAVRYAAMGRRLLPEDAWQAEPALAVAMDLQAAEASYVAERFGDAREIAGAVLKRATRREDRVAAHNVLIGIGVAEKRFVDATDYAIGVLARELGVRLPRRPSMARVLAELARTRQALGRLDTAELLALPAMGDPTRLDAMAMLMKAATNAYWGNPTLVPLIAATMVRLSRRHGNTGLSAYGYALTGMVLTNAFASVALGYRLGRLSMDLLARTGDRHLIGKTGLLWHGFIRHSSDPLRVCAADVLECYDAAMDAGDVENAVYCGTVAYYADLLSGRPLDWIATRYQGYLEALLGSAQRQTILALKVWVQVAANLRDQNRVEPQARGAHVDWPHELEGLLAQPGAQTTIATICGGPGLLAFLLDDLAEAERQFALLYERQKAAMGQAFLKPCLALYALVLARKRARGVATAGDRLRLLRLRRMLAGWARHNRHDYAAFQDLLAAELAYGRGLTARAMARWGDAMERARDSGFLYLEAWAAERSARAHAEAGHTGLARHLWDRARAGWQRSGMLARLRLIDRQEVGAEAPAAGHGGPFLAEQGDRDVESVLEAVRAVSEIVEIDRLVDRVLRILLVSAGARR